jgi:hypothetical protein
VFLFSIERMRLSLSLHPQLSNIALRSGILSHNALALKMNNTGWLGLAMDQFFPGDKVAL